MVGCLMLMFVGFEVEVRAHSCFGGRPRGNPKWPVPFNIDKAIHTHSLLAIHYCSVVPFDVLKVVLTTFQLYL